MAESILGSQGVWRKPARKGEPQRFIETVALLFELDECLDWPFAKDSKGYGKLKHNGKADAIAPRVVCELVHGAPPTPKHEAAHSCGNGHLGCVNPRHLSWKTRLENRADSIAHGTHVKGSDHKVSKLSESQVRDIKLKSAAGVGTSVLASEYSVAPGTIHSIATGKHWAWVRP